MTRELIKFLLFFKGFSCSEERTSCSTEVGVLRKAEGKESTKGEPVMCRKQL
jgi:hypothetical protein